MPKQLQCAQGHQWETGIGRRGQVPVMIPVCPMCGASPVRKWSDWRDLSWTTRIVFLTILGLIPLTIFGVLYFLHRHQQLVRDTLAAEEGPVNAVAFSSEGDFFAAAGEDGTLLLWNLSTDQEPATLTRNHGPIAGATFLPQGKVLVSAGKDGTIKWWQVPDGTWSKTLDLHTSTVGIACAPDGRSLAIGCANKQVILLSQKNDTKPVKLTHRDRVRSLAYAPDSELLAVGDRAGTITLWEVAKAKRFAVFDCKGGAITALAFGADRRILAAGTEDGNLMLWDALTGRRHHTWKGYKYPVHALSFAPGKMLLASASPDGPVKLWEVADDHLKERSSCSHFQGNISCLAFSPDGKTLALGNRDGTVILWNILGLLLYGPEDQQP
jgi:WD40 repeat protein